MSSRKKNSKRKQEKKLKRARLKKAKSPFQGPFGGDMKVILSPPGEAKMSEVLVEFVDPYLEGIESEDALKKLLTLGMVAWNAAVVLGSKGDELVERILEKVPADSRSTLKRSIEDLILRKKTYFADIKRLFIDFKLVMTPNGPHVSVLSTFPTP